MRRDGVWKNMYTKKINQKFRTSIKSVYVEGEGKLLFKVPRENFLWRNCLDLFLSHLYLSIFFPKIKACQNEGSKAGGAREWLENGRRIRGMAGGRSKSSARRWLEVARVIFPCLRPRSEESLNVRTPECLSFVERNSNRSE